MDKTQFKQIIQGLADFEEPEEGSIQITQLHSRQIVCLQCNLVVDSRQVISLSRRVDNKWHIRCSECKPRGVARFT